MGASKGDQVIADPQTQVGTTPYDYTPTKRLAEFRNQIASIRKITPTQESGDLKVNGSNEGDGNG